MEEHFNENYAESDQYPKATFKGSISNFSLDKVSNTDAQMTYNGSLTFHGKTKSLEGQYLTISKSSDSKMIISGELKLNVADFDIEIPKIVSNKLSKEINVTFRFQLKSK